MKKYKSIYLFLAIAIISLAIGFYIGYHGLFINQAVTKKELIEGNYTVGVDIKPGIYNIKSNGYHTEVIIETSSKPIKYKHVGLLETNSSYHLSLQRGDQIYIKRLASIGTVDFIASK